MKKALSLLAVTMLTASSTGCNCCPCLRNICPFGACASTSAPPPVATYAAVPASPCGPAPVFASAPMAQPVFAAAPQQYTVPQYAAPMAMPAQPVYSEAGCGAAYADQGCGMPYMAADQSCGCVDVGYGSPEGQQMMIDPSPAP